MFIPDQVPDLHNVITVQNQDLMTDTRDVTDLLHQPIVPTNPQTLTIDTGLQVRTSGTILHAAQTTDVNTGLLVPSIHDTDLLVHDGTIRDMCLNHDHPTIKPLQGLHLTGSRTNLATMEHPDKISHLIHPGQVIKRILADTLPIVMYASKTSIRKTPGS